jgi:hypothetical protein
MVGVGVTQEFRKCCFCYVIVYLLQFWWEVTLLFVFTVTLGFLVISRGVRFLLDVEVSLWFVLLSLFCSCCEVSKFEYYECCGGSGG